MTGIIINDSIVLVTTIDEYAKDRGLIPSIIDGVANRLRPVMLTTLTTVLGLLPLLFERSSQAQFLKPTVVTLVYGLGFGMLLVLLVVPSLIAMQYDVRRRVDAYKRGLGFRASGPRAALLALSGLVAGWLAATLGYAAVNGALLPFITQLVPRLGEMSAMPAALLIFVVGLSVMVASAFAFSLLALTLMRRGQSEAA